MIIVIVTEREEKERERHEKKRERHERRETREEKREDFADWNNTLPKQKVHGQRISLKERPAECSYGNPKKTYQRNHERPLALVIDVRPKHDDYDRHISLEERPADYSHGTPKRRISEVMSDQSLSS